MIDRVIKLSQVPVGEPHPLQRRRGESGMVGDRH